MALLSLTQSISTLHPIVILVAPPRSLSTALLRMISQTGVFQMINEPSARAYHAAHYPNEAAFYSESACQSYADVAEYLFDRAKQGPVFVKEMSFAFEAFIRSQPDIAAYFKIQFVFLLRDPHAAMISYYKKLLPDYREFLMPILVPLTGYDALYRSYGWLCKQGIQRPYLMHAESLYHAPESAISALCEYLHIPFQANYLQWDPLDHRSGRYAWEEYKRHEVTTHWHQDAILSQGFHQPTVYETDSEGHPTFSEIRDAVHQTQCQAAYEKNRGYYEKLIKEMVCVDSLLT